ncbi:MAG: GDSL-type esterase/lipase family protein [Pseudomonadota bacterium]
MRRTVLMIGGLIFLAASALFGFLLYVLLSTGDPTYWAGDIAGFERRDVSNPPPRGAVLFLGDDDVRQWNSLARDMAPIPVIARGFGGAQISHITYYIPRIVVPYRPRAIVLMAGSSDMSGAHERRPEDVLADIEAFVTTLRKAHVTAPVYFVSILPEPMRQSRWLGRKRANALVAAYAAKDKSLHFIDVAPAFTTGADVANDEMFDWFGLDLNGQGRAVLAASIKDILLRDGYAPPPRQK